MRSEGAVPEGDRVFHSLVAADKSREWMSELMGVLATCSPPMTYTMLPTTEMVC
jgi:hypothetical protein